ncbi:MULTISPECIES: FAD-binding oxidoreductase [unclassified Pseudomonas]|uniref:FAD-binding oxidoreductase n=1 Tax=unclassified Pseudomonas TaxID=196821 RepID=UPI002AC9195B|nr:MULTISPECIES: FAD-binding oxidoreductase [unclassified Pseudomonas]MEB0047237.1 FAD-binding oxidoreductase [Pseudomonas sp. Dout3]MEB0096877.1 FAD-binding oxidoreductase [Pseudomonas sp. DC1.2]WPX57389.1 FAD-binding oxidoreductase [Pseudomonas sp. DC1.2]
MTDVGSWGRLGKFPHTVQPVATRKRLLLEPGKQGLAYGNGRSYGDVCLNPDGVLWTTSGLDHLITFDAETGVLECEAGTLLRDIQRTFVPRGWMLPVTPGTQLLSVGGAIANDVHGKNHHVMGTFGDQVLALQLLRTNGEVIDCGHTERSEWFTATVGGMGLTGVVTQARLQLRRVTGPWLETENVPYANLNDFFEVADDSESGWEHTVSWIDCVSRKGARGIFMRGNHTNAVQGPKAKTRQITVPFAPPVSLVNRLTLKPFNIAYYQLQAYKRGRSLAHYESFFYPLDNVLEWNRVYGPRGFYQYQSVVPRDVGQDAVSAMLKEIARSGDGSFLAVLKTFADRQPVGMMSFPQPGLTLALDFPNHGAQTHALFARLDAIVSEAGGRIYMAKDARMPRELFESGYPRLNEFLNYRDPGISSSMSRRLMGY